MLWRTIWDGTVQLLVLHLCMVLLLARSFLLPSSLSTRRCFLVCAHLSISLRLPSQDPSQMIHLHPKYLTQGPIIRISDTLLWRTHYSPFSNLDLKTGHDDVRLIRGTDGTVSCGLPAKTPLMSRAHSFRHKTCPLRASAKRETIPQLGYPTSILHNISDCFIY